MPKGRGQYATGEAIAVKQLTCGLVFSGNMRLVQKLAQLHALGCTDCQKCKYGEMCTVRAAPESTKPQLLAQVVAETKGKRVTSIKTTF